MLADIEGSCETALEVLNGLLDYERLESGIMKLQRKKFHPWSMVNDSVRPFIVQV